MVDARPSSYRPSNPPTQIERFAAGRKYEAKVNSYLRKAFPLVQLQPSFEFRSSSRGKWKIKIPDAIIVYPNRVVCFEIKLTHCLEAWEQLRGTYSPILYHVFQRPVEVVEVCKMYSSGINIPEEVIHTTMDELRIRYPVDGRYYLIVGDFHEDQEPSAIPGR